MRGHDRIESRNEVMLLRRGGRSGRNWRNDLGQVRLVGRVGEEGGTEKDEEGGEEEGVGGEGYDWPIVIKI